MMLSLGAIIWHIIVSVMVAFPLCDVLHTLKWIYLEWTTPDVPTGVNTRGVVVIKGEISHESVVTWKKQLIEYDEDIDLVIDTPGGAVSATVALCHVILNFPRKIHTWIPYMAGSGGTLLALCACTKGEVVMGRYAFLTMTDPITTVTTVESYPIWYQWFYINTKTRSHDVNTLEETEDRPDKEFHIVRRHASHRCLEDTVYIIRTAMKGSMRLDQLDVLVRELTRPKRTHSFPLDRRWCKEHHIPISDSCEIPRRILEALGSPCKVDDSDD